MKEYREQCEYKAEKTHRVRREEIKIPYLPNVYTQKKTPNAMLKVFLSTGELGNAL
jgi:hypothetical protein